MKEFKEYGPLPESRCPQCNYVLTGASNPNGDGEPEPGCASVCLNCGQLMIFADDLTLRKANALDVRELMAWPEAWNTVQKAQMIIQQRGRFQ
jgi:hypothetical protein